MPVWRYDLISNGEGPVGLTAGICARQARLHAARLEKPSHGGSKALVVLNSPSASASRASALGGSWRTARSRSSFPASRCTSWSWKAGGDHARSTASGDGTIAALAVARYLEKRKQG